MGRCERDVRTRGRPASRTADAVLAWARDHADGRDVVVHAELTVGDETILLRLVGHEPGSD